MSLWKFNDERQNYGPFESYATTSRIELEPKWHPPLFRPDEPPPSHAFNVGDFVTFYGGKQQFFGTVVGALAGAVLYRVMDLGMRVGTVHNKLIYPAIWTFHGPMRKDEL